MTEFTINSSVNKTTGFAPFELIYGHLPQMVTSIPSSEFIGVQDFTQKDLDNLQSAHDAILMNRIRQVIQANKHRLPDPPLEVGNLIYLSTKDLNLPRDEQRSSLPYLLVHMKFSRLMRIPLIIPLNSLQSWKNGESSQSSTFHGSHPMSLMMNHYFLGKWPRHTMILERIQKKSSRSMKMK